MKQFFFQIIAITLFSLSIPYSKLHSRIATPSIDTCDTHDLSTDEIIAELIDKESNTNKDTKKEKSPSTSSLRDDLPMDTNGNSRLHWLARVGDATELERVLKKADCENWLEQAKNTLNNNGLSPLHTAAMYGKGETAQVLKKFGFDMLTEDRWGNLPVHYACLFAQEHNTVIYFLDHTENLEVVAEMGLTPLAQLILRDHKALVDYCISKGALTHYAITLDTIGEFIRLFPHLENRVEEFIFGHRYGLVALSQAVGNYEVTTTLLEAGAPITKVHELVEPPRTIANRSLSDRLKVWGQLKLGLPVTDYRGNNPLSRVIKDGQNIQIFLSAGSDVNWLHEQTNASAVHMAVAKNKPQALIELLALPQTDPNIQMWENRVWERRGNTPLMLALNLNHPSTVDGNVIDILLTDPRVVAGLLTQDNSGRTALHIASQNSTTNVAKLLAAAPNEKIKQKMITATDNGGRTAHTHARLTDSAESRNVVILLTELGATMQELPEEDPKLPINVLARVRRSLKSKPNPNVTPGGLITPGAPITSMPIAGDSGNGSLQTRHKQLTITGIPD